MGHPASGLILNNNVIVVLKFIYEESQYPEYIKNAFGIKGYKTKSKN